MSGHFLSHVGRTKSSSDIASELFVQKYRIALSFICFPVDIYMFKINKRNTRTRREICSELTIKFSGGRERGHWERMG